MRRCTTVAYVNHDGTRAIIRTNAVDLHVLFVTDDIVRIWARFEPESYGGSYSLAMTAWEESTDELLSRYRTRVSPPASEIIDESETVRILGARLEVRIDKNPFRIAVYDGENLMHQDVVDLAWREDMNNRRIHALRMNSDDRFYGFGEKTGRLDKAGTVMSMNPRDSLGYDPKKTDSLYKHIPFFIKMDSETRRATGYFYHNSYECEFNMGRSISNYWPPHATYRVDGGDIDLFLIAGPSIREVVQHYTLLTGRSAMLPRAALGYLGSSMYYPELPESADDAVINFIDTTRRYDIPIDGFQLSSGYTQYLTQDGYKRCTFTWNSDRFSDPSGFFQQMRDRHIVVSPNVKPGFLLTHPETNSMRERNMFIRKAESDDAVIGAWWGGPGYFVDFTAKQARDEWKKMLTQHLLAYGATSVWNDNCEYDSIVDLDARVDYEGRGSTVAHLRTVMANLMCHVTEEALRELYPSERPFIVCRGGHSGIQRYAQTWSGDNATSWESLRYNISTMLGMSLSGVANQGADIGGFFGPAPDAELFVRWVQHGIFQPRFSIHSANTDYTVTEPWMYSDHTERIQKAIAFRYRLMPTMYSLMERAHRTGLPIVEPLCSAFQHDPECDSIDTDFMLGDSLLVSNVIAQGETKHSTYLPAGHIFYDFYTRTPFEGGQHITQPVTLDSIPLYIKDGSITVLSADPTPTHTGTDIRAHHIIVAPGDGAKTVLYEDDGHTFDYLDNKCLLTEITVKPGTELTIDFNSQGNYRSSVDTISLDVLHPEFSPVEVRIGSEEITHYIDRTVFERAESGWYYSQTLRSVLITYPNPHHDHRITISCDVPDLIGM